MAALSVTNPDRVIHKFNSVFASGKQNGRPRCVAFLTVDICPEKANVELVFRKYIGLDRAIREDLRKRFEVEIEGISPDKTICHFIPMPLQSVNDLSKEDQRLSISSDVRGNYHFPLVKNLDWIIKHVDSSEELSENEQYLLDQTVKPVVEKLFPESERSSMSTDYVQETVVRTRKKRRAEKREPTENNCGQQLLAVALLGLVVSSVALQALSLY